MICFVNTGVIRPGDVIIHSISCLPVLDPFSNEDTSWCPGLFTRAQHAITMSLSVTETALVHLTTGVSEGLSRATSEDRGLKCKQVTLVEIKSNQVLNRSHMTVFLPVFAKTMNPALSPLSLVNVWLILFLIRYNNLPVTKKKTSNTQTSVQPYWLLMTKPQNQHVI